MSARPTSPEQVARAGIVVDLAAIRHNVRRLRELTRAADGSGPLMMTVVKADGYGHGMHEVARAAREAGADWIGVATIDEAVALRDRSEEHTSELQSLMRISYAGFCLK